MAMAVVAVPIVAPIRANVALVIRVHFLDVIGESLDAAEDQHRDQDLQHNTTPRWAFRMRNE